MRCSCGHENPSSAVNCQRCGQSLATGNWPTTPAERCRRLLIDAGAAAGLMLALVWVFLIDKNRDRLGWPALSTIAVTST